MHYFVAPAFVDARKRRIRGAALQSEGRNRIKKAGTVIAACEMH
jgi:hypothetical protein